MAENTTGIHYSIIIDDSQMRDAAKKGAEAFETISDSAAASGSAIDGAFKKIAKAAGSVFSIKAAMDFARQVIAVRKEVESLEVSFRTLLGSEQKAGELMSQLREFAVSTPLQLNDLAKSAQTLLSFNIEAEKIMPTLKAIGDISMGDAQKFQSLTLAFSQMSSTGKLMGQDLLQMINAGFNPLTVMAEKTGKSVAELMNEMSKGAISAEAVAQAFQDATAEGGKFHGMLESQSKTVQGAFSNLKGAIQDMMNDIGQSVQEPLTGALTSITGVVKNYEKLGSVIASTAVSFGIYKAAVMAVTAVQEAGSVSAAVLTAQTKALAAAQSFLSKTMLANPYVLAATAVAALVTSIALYARRTRETRTEQEKMRDVLQKSADAKRSLKEETDQLVATIENEDASMVQRNEAYKKLQDMYPEYLKNVEREVFLREKLPDFKQKAGDMIDQKDLDDMQQMISYLDLYIKNKQLMSTPVNSRQYEPLRSEVEQLKKEMGNLYDATYWTKAAEAAKKAGFNTVDEYYKALIQAKDQREQEIKEARFEELPIEEKIIVTESSIKTTEYQIMAVRKKIEENPWQVNLYADLSQLEGQLKDLQDKQAGLSGQAANGVTWNIKEVTKQIADYSKALKEARKSGSKTAAEAAEKNLDQAKASYKLLTGKDYDSVSKNAQEMKKLKEKLDKELLEAEREYADVLIRQSRESVLNADQTAVNAMADGTDKKLAQAELDYRRQLAAAEDYEKQLVEQLAAIEEKRWKAANPTAVKNGEQFDTGQVTADMLSEQQKQQVEAMRKNAEAARRIAVTEAEATRQALLNEYQDLQSKIQGIRSKYEQLEREAGDDAAMRSRIAQARAKETSDLILDTFKSEDSIGKLAEQIDQLGTAARNALAGKLRQLVELIQQAKLGNLQMSAFKVAAKDIAEMTGASEELIQAYINDNDAFAKLIEYVEAIENAAEPIDTLTEAVDNFRKAKEKARSGGIIDINNFEEAKKILDGMIKSVADQALDELSRIGDALREVGQLIGNENLEKAGDIVDDIVGNIKAAEQGAEAWGGWWGAIIGGLTDLVPKIVKWLNAGTDASVAEIEKAVAHAERMADYWKSIYNQGGGVDFTGDIDAYIEAAERLRKAQKAYYNDLVWGSGGDRSKKLREEYDNALAEVKRLQEEMFSGTSVSSREAFSRYMASIDSIIAETEAKIEELSKHPKKNADEIEQLLIYLSQLMQEKADETAAYWESVVGKSADTMAQDLVDMASEAFDKGKDSIDDFADYFKNTVYEMIKSQVLLSAIQKYVSGIIEKIGKATEDLLSGAITDEEYNAMLDQYADELENRLNEGYNKLKGMTDLLDRYKVDEASTAASKGIATASQDSIDELNGRMTVIQANTAALVSSSALNASNTSGILSVVTGIKSDTASIRSDIAEMRGDLHSVKNKVNQM